jgi:DNA-binding IclR family transcriptional regulator
VARATKNETSGRYDVAVLANALDILYAIGERPTGVLSTAEASQKLGISRSTAYRLLMTMLARGFVDRDPEGNGWTLGWRFFALAQRTRADKLRAVAAAAMRRVLEQESETVNLAAFTGDELVYIATLDSPRAFRMTEAPGETAPLHATSLGKAVLAALPGEALTTALEKLEFVRITDSTIRTREALEAQLEETRRRGWSVEHGETETGVSCVGAAILDGDGLPVAAISVSVPDVRLKDGRADRIGLTLAKESQAISEQLAGKRQQRGKGTPRTSRK